LLPSLLIICLLVFDRMICKETRFNLQDFLFLLLEMLVIWVSFGISFWLVFPINAGFVTAIIGAFSISWFAGYVAFFAPGGIGIREYLLTVILVSYFSSSEVAIYATVHRLIWVIVEVILGAGSALLFGIPMTAKEETVEEAEN